MRIENTIEIVPRYIKKRFINQNMFSYVKHLKYNKRIRVYYFADVTAPAFLKRKDIILI